MAQLAQALVSISKPAAPQPPPGGGALDAESYRNLLSHAMGVEGDAITQGSGSKVSGQWALERIKRTRREKPEIVWQAACDGIQEQLGVLEGEAWSFRRHAEQELVPACGNFSTLKRMLMILAAVLDEGRAYGASAQTAMLVHAYRVLEATARDPQHEMQWPWPLLGIPDPAGRQRAAWAPGESAAVVAFHREEAALEESKRKLGRRSDDPAGGGPSDTQQVPGWLRARILAEAKNKAAAGKAPKGKGKGDAGAAAPKAQEPS